MNKQEFFVTDAGLHLPVDLDQHLLRILNTTSAGTNYWESPPPGPLTDRQIGRILLQVHQIIDKLPNLVSGSRFLDVGCGNGMVGRMLSTLIGLESIGVDPFLDGEHMTSWQKSDHGKEFDRLIALINSKLMPHFDLESYKHLLSSESFSVHPKSLYLSTLHQVNYKFAQISGHSIGSLDGQFDAIYCKSIEHISDWPGLLAAMIEKLCEGGRIYIKHRSFYSYLGPHRYASTGIPWGHLLLTDSEYERYCQRYHSGRAESMINFYLGGLCRERTSVNELLIMANQSGLVVEQTLYESPHYSDKVTRLTPKIPRFWELVNGRYPKVSADEVLSGLIHIVLRKA